MWCYTPVFIGLNLCSDNVLVIYMHSVCVTVSSSAKILLDNREKLITDAICN